MNVKLLAICSIPLCHIGQGQIAYFYVSGIWDKKISRFNKNHAGKRIHIKGCVLT
jgi:hypothetical protein